MAWVETTFEIFVYAGYMLVPTLGLMMCLPNEWFEYYASWMKSRGGMSRKVILGGVIFLTVVVLSTTALSGFFAHHAGNYLVYPISLILFLLTAGLFAVWPVLYFYPCNDKCSAISSLLGLTFLVSGITAAHMMIDSLWLSAFLMLPLVVVSGVFWIIISLQEQECLRATSPIFEFVNCKRELVK